MICGFVVIDKPAGKSSHDLVNVVRRLSGVKKVGHTGTLDPFATGVLPVAVGEATKAIPFLDEGRKEYRAVMRLGGITDTQDCTGNIIESRDWRNVTIDSLTYVFSGFMGVLEQLPPMYSALKHNGVPLYRIARRGDEISRTPRAIEIFTLAIEKVDLPDVDFTVSCSRGTYVRTLAHDIGIQLGCGAHLISLRRTASGPFLLENALSFDRLAAVAAEEGLENILLSPRDALGHLRNLQLNEQGAERISHGIPPRLEDCIAFPEPLETGELLRVSTGQKLIAVARVTDGADQAFTLARVFN